MRKKTDGGGPIIPRDYIRKPGRSDGRRRNHIEKNQQKPRNLVLSYIIGAAKRLGVFVSTIFFQQKKIDSNSIIDHAFSTSSHYEAKARSHSICSPLARSIRKSSRSESSSFTESTDVEAHVSPSILSFKEVCNATGNFSSAHLIGEGGLGNVYHGKLKDGTPFAVKRAKMETYDQSVSAEFMNEIRTLSKIEHLNLVGLYGYHAQGDERLIVYEYVSNGNLREHLNGTRGNGLEISERLDIAIDVAHAITYLHSYTDCPIIHRDIRASNILLTEKLRAKVTGFGFARLVEEDPSLTHISTQIKGTAGYLDPEYLQTYQLTEMNDVYSFGVLLVAMMTGRYPIESRRSPAERLTIKWALRCLKEGEAVVTMDPRLRRSAASIQVVENVLQVACQCLAPSRLSRPSMRKCAQVLWKIRKEYRESHSTD